MSKAARPGFLKSLAQGLARWAGIPVDAGDGTAFNLGDRVPQLNGAHSTLQLSSAWACVSLIADTIGTLPLGFFEKTQDGRKPATDHTLFRVFREQPNVDQTTCVFFSSLVASMLLRGVGYAEKQRSAGRIIGLKFLNYDFLSCVTVNGRKKYRYTENGKVREIPEADVWKIIGFSLDGVNGCSAIEYGCRVFGAARSADIAALATFDKGLMPTTFFKFPTVLKPTQRKETRKTIEALSGAYNAGRPIVLEAGMDAGTLGIKPVDAQLLESRAYSVEEICSWFSVPPFMIGRASQGQTNWGTGIEQQMIGFVTFTLRKWLRRIEQAIAKDLLTSDERRKYYAEFAVEGLLRGDSASRREFYASALQNGWMNRDQVANLENLPKPKGGEIYTVQSNLIPVEKLGMLPPQPATTRAAAAALMAALSIGHEESDNAPQV
jgi:HK97 family phage portal protein